MKALYFDIISGISGDMTLAALLQIVPKCDELASIINDTFNVDIKIALTDKFINGVLCKKLVLHIPHEPHIHRNFNFIRNKIESSSIPDSVKKDAIGIFYLIAQSEAKIHGKTVDEVHFHEVGSIDSIIDILGASYLFSQIKAKIISSPAKLGHGIVNVAHGAIPVPAPATIDILKDFPVERLDVPSELTTPTGAAILKYYVKDVSYHFRGAVKNIVYSTGSKEFKEIPNMLRVIELEDGVFSGNIVLIETNIDDTTGEHLGGVVEILINEGALDVFFTPIYMKKNRPGYMLSVLCKEEKKDRLMEAIFRHTSAAGMRFQQLSRYEMERDSIQIDLYGHKIRVKKLVYNDIAKYAPEWEDVKKVSQILNKTTIELYEALNNLMEKSP